MTETTQSILQIMLDALRIMLAYGVFLLLLLLMMSNWAMPYFNVLKPQLVLVLVYYWTLYRPTLMPPWVIFVAGILLDLTTPVLPIGTHAASYLLISAILKPRRRMMMGQSFIVVWAGFVVATLMDLLLKWLLINLFSASSLDFQTMLLNGLMTVLSFPLLVMVLVTVHRLLPPGRGMIAR